MIKKRYYISFILLFIIIFVIFKIFSFCPQNTYNRNQINTFPRDYSKFELKNGYDEGPYHIDYNDLKSIPWNIKAPNMAGHAANIQKCSFLGPLLYKYYETKDTKYLIIAKKICMEWIKIHQNKTGDISPFAWWEMVEGSRACFSKIFVACENENLLNTNEKQIFLECLYKHTIHLMNEKNINYDTNHGLSQIISQLNLSRILMPYDAIYKKSHKQAQRRLNKIIKKQFYIKDGIHKENSASYHYICSYWLYESMNRGDLNFRQQSFVKKIYDNIFWFILPDGYIVNLGDSDYYRELQDLHKYKGNAKENYKVFREAGYFIVKHGQSYLIQHSGFGSYAHRHSDDLGFHWFDLGQNILMDSGKYAYVGKPADSQNELQNYMYQIRQYVLSNRAHNTLEFNDKNNPRSKNALYKNAIKKAGYNIKGNFYFVTSKVKINNINFERTLYYSPEKYLIVKDTFNSGIKTLTTAKQWFHLAPDLEMKKDGEKYIIDLKNNNKIVVSQLSDQAKADRLYKGEKEPLIQGWISMAYDEIEPNYAFNYEIKNQNKGKFITIFEINDNKVPDDILNNIK